jgi:hypothetical protein
VPGGYKDKIMKKNLLFLLIVLFAACSDDNEEISSIKENTCEYLGNNFDIKDCIISTEILNENETSHGIYIDLFSKEIDCCHALINDDDEAFYASNELLGVNHVSVYTDKWNVDEIVKNGTYDLSGASLFMGINLVDLDDNDFSQEYEKYINSGTLILSDSKISITGKDKDGNQFSINYNGNITRQSVNSNILAGNWERMGDFEGLPRSGAVCVVLDNKVYVSTGYYNGNADDYRLKDMWEYDPTTQQWTRMADMPDEALARNKAVGFGAAGKVYVGTGYGEYVTEGITYEEKLKDFYEYDPATKTWTRIADFPGTARYDAIAFSLNDKGYVGTGYDDNELSDLWQYDPATGQWTEKASYDGSTRRGAVVFVIDDKAYVCTGVSNGTYVSDFYYYDSDADTWTQLRNIADISDYGYDDDYDNIIRSYGVAFVMNGKGYVVTGSRGGAGETCWEYDPATDLWNEKTGLREDGDGSSSRLEAIGFTVNGIGYVGLGRSSDHHFDDMWRFEPNKVNN